MASIRYTSIINSRNCEEGFGGNLTNYTYYTMLVAYDDGTKQIAEGRYNDIAYLIPYIRTPIDEICELKAAVRELKEDLTLLADEKIRYVTESLYPVPEVSRLNEDEAQQLIRDAGLIPVPVNVYPENVPHHGVVRSYRRAADNFRNIELDIIHKTPDVVGLTTEEALEKLQAEGFRVSVSRVFSSDDPGNTVLACSRGSDTSMELKMEVTAGIPDIAGLNYNEAAGLLSENGIKTVKLQEYSTAYEKDTVIRWENTDASAVRLFVCAGPAIVSARSVTVSCDPMQETSGDKYSAKAGYNMIGRELEIEVAYTVQEEGRTILSVENAGEGDRPYTQDIGLSMLPGVPGTFKITVPCSDPAEKPSEYEIIILTQSEMNCYGESMEMSFTFEW